MGFPYADFGGEPRQAAMPLPADQLAALLASLDRAGVKPVAYTAGISTRKTLSVTKLATIAVCGLACWLPVVGAISAIV